MLDSQKKREKELAQMKPLVACRSTDAFTKNIDDYPDGIVIPINKPYRWTSADVIRKVKYAAKKNFNKKNLKVGHAGTLDPLATGILIVCIGKATKLAETFQAHDKEYIAGISFGATTPSYDLEKEIDRLFPYEHISKELIESHLEEFLGEQDQVAPLFSAKSVDGVRAYELARKLFKQKQEQGLQTSFDQAAEGIIQTAKIRITNLELLSFKKGKTKNEAIVENKQNSISPIEGASSRINVTDNSYLGLPEAKIKIACSKGTYIRAFARDLGEALESGAHLNSLVRSKSGQFKIEDALSIDEACLLLGLDPQI